VQGSDPGQLESPVGLATDRIGRVYIADRATGFVQKFSAAGMPLLCFEHPSVHSSAAIAVDNGGAIYVANPRAGEIQVFFPEGEPLRVLRVAPQRNFEGPFGFSVDAGGDIYVPDSAGGRIQVLNARGRLERVWKAPPDVAGIGLHPAFAIAGPDGYIYAADAVTGRIVKFTRDGAQVTEWQVPGGTAPLQSLAVSATDVFVLRGANPRMEVFTLDGKPELADNLGGQLEAASPIPRSLGLAPSGELVVLDPAARRILQFRINFGSH